MNDKPHESDSKPQSNVLRMGIPVVVILAAFWLYTSSLKRTTDHEPGLGESLEFVLQPLLGANQNVDNKGLPSGQSRVDQLLGNLVSSMSGRIPLHDQDRVEVP